MAVTAAEILENFATGSAVKDSDQFLMGIIGNNNSITLMKVTADLVRAYLYGQVLTKDVQGTLDGEPATLETILTKIQDMLEKSGLIEFDGFVDGVNIRQVSIGGTPDGVYYDRVNNTFCVRVGNSYANNYIGMTDYQPEIFVGQSSVNLYKMRVYKNKEDGMSYMWNGSGLVPLID